PTPMSRPEILFPLFTELTTLEGVGPKTARNFARMGVTRPVDLILTLPSGGTDRRLRASIMGADLPMVLTVEVEVGMHRAPSTRGRPYRIHVRDAATEFRLVFFHARPDWLRAQLPAGSRRIVSGRVEFFDGMAEMVHPDHILRPGDDGLPEYEPVYPLTEGLTLRVMTRAVQDALTRVQPLPEWIDPQLKAREGWPDWAPAIRAAHAPRDPADLAPTTPARERLAYDELLAHQMTLALARARTRRASGVASRGDGSMRAKVLAALPYTPTGAQTRAVAEITADMAAPLRMNRLLQGDDGAGKTRAAMLAMLAAVEPGGQAAMMAPTEILARQHK